MNLKLKLLSCYSLPHIMLRLYYLLGSDWLGSVRLLMQMRIMQAGSFPLSRSPFVTVKGRQEVGPRSSKLGQGSSLLLVAPEYGTTPWLPSQASILRCQVWCWVRVRARQGRRLWSHWSLEISWRWKGVRLSF